MGIVKLQKKRNMIQNIFPKNVLKTQDPTSLNNITFSIIKILDENPLIKGDVFTSCYLPSCDT